MNRDVYNTRRAHLVLALPGDRPCGVTTVGGLKCTSVCMSRRRGDTGSQLQKSLTRHLSSCGGRRMHPPPRRWGLGGHGRNHPFDRTLRPATASTGTTHCPREGPLPAPELVLVHQHRRQQPPDDATFHKCFHDGARVGVGLQRRDTGGVVDGGGGGRRQPPGAGDDEGPGVEGGQDGAGEVSTHGCTTGWGSAPETVPPAAHSGRTGSRSRARHTAACDGPPPRGSAGSPRGGRPPRRTSGLAVAIWTTICDEWL